MWIVSGKGAFSPCGERRLIFFIFGKEALGGVAAAGEVVLVSVGVFYQIKITKE
jgi:hypothetical protein